MTLVSSFTNSLSRKAISKFVGRQFSPNPIVKAIGAAKTALSLHENYSAVQAFGVGNIPSLDGKWDDQITGHDGGAVGGKASTFAGAETFGLSGTNGPHTTFSAGFVAKTSAAGSVYAFGDYTGSQGWVAGLASGKFQVVAQEAAGNIKNYLSTELFNDGLWHFFFFVIESGVLTLFVDGRSVSVTKTADQSVTTIGAGSGSSWRISGYNVNSSRWIGQIQFPMQWNSYALTDQEITLLADSLTLPSTSPDFLGYLIGDKCYDLTGNESTVTGTATITEYSNVDVPVAPFDLDRAGYRSSGGLIIPKRINSDLAADGNALTYSVRAKQPAQLRKGNAIVLSGSEVITIPNSTDFSGEDWTLSGYVVIDSVGIQQSILSQQDGTGAGRSWLYSQTTSNFRTFLGGSLQIFTNTVAAGKLYYFEFEKSGATFTLRTTNLTDGLAEESDSITATMESASGDFVVGGSKLLSDKLTGKVFGFKLDHANGFELPMCERSGVTLHDVKNGNHGTATATITHTDAVNDVVHWPENKGFSGTWVGDGTVSEVIIADTTGMSNVDITFDIKTSDAKFIIFSNTPSGSPYLFAAESGSESTGISTTSGGPDIVIDGVTYVDGVNTRGDIHAASAISGWVTVSIPNADLTGYLNGFSLSGHPTTSFRFTGQIRNLVIDGVSYPGTIVPAKEDGSADALGNTITNPAGKLRDTGTEVDFDPDDKYQWTDNLYQGMTGDGTGYLTLDSAITLSGAFEISFRAFASSFDQAGMVLGHSSETEKIGFSATGSGKVFVRLISTDAEVDAPANGADHEFVITRNASNVCTIKINGTETSLYSGAAQSGDVIFDQIFKGGSDIFTGRIRNLKIVNAGTTVLDMSGKNLLDLSGQTNHATITAAGVTFSKQTLNDHAFGDLEPLPTSIDQSISGEESKMIHFTI